MLLKFTEIFYWFKNARLTTPLRATPQTSVPPLQIPGSAPDHQNQPYSPVVVIDTSNVHNFGWAQDIKMIQTSFFFI